MIIMNIIISIFNIILSHKLTPKMEHKHKNFKFKKNAQVCVKRLSTTPNYLEREKKRREKKRKKPLTTLIKSIVIVGALSLVNHNRFYQG